MRLEGMMRPPSLVNLIFISNFILCHRHFSLGLKVDGFMEQTVYEGSKAAIPCCFEASECFNPGPSRKSAGSRTTTPSSLGRHFAGKITSAASNKIISSQSNNVVNDTILLNGLENDEVALVFWYKGLSGSPLFTLEFVSSASEQTTFKIQSHVKSSSPRITIEGNYSREIPAWESQAKDSRARFKNEAKRKSGGKLLAIPSLAISGVNAEDTSDFRCRVDYKKSRTKNFVIHLKVIVPPKEVSLLDSNGNKISNNVIGPLEEGSDQVIFCESFGLPPPKLSWWFLNGQAATNESAVASNNIKMIDDDYFITPNGVSRSGLILFNLTRAHLKSQLLCKSSQSVKIGITNLGHNPNSSFASSSAIPSFGGPNDVSEDEDDDGDNPEELSRELPSPSITSSVDHMDSETKHEDRWHSSEEWNQGNENVSVVELHETVSIDLILKPTEISLVLETKGPILSGKNTRFTCKSKGSRPAGKIKWFLGYHEITPSMIRSNPFVIVDREEDEDLIHGDVDHDNDLLQHISKFVNKYMKKQHKSDGFYTDHLNRENISFFTSNPVNDQRLTFHNASSPAIRKNKITISILSMVPDASDNGKHLTCRTFNPVLYNSYESNSLEETIRLDVNYVPELVLSFGPNINRNLIREGSDVYVECHIRSNPFVYDVIWTFKGQQLTSNRSEGIIIANQSLVLQNIQRRSSGHFQCSGRNDVGIGYSNELFIRVQYAPFCAKNQRTIYSLAASGSSDLAVICDVDADPSEDLSFKWIFNSSSINPFISQGNWFAPSRTATAAGHQNYMTEITSFTVNGTRSVATISTSFTPSSLSHSQVSSKHENFGKSLSKLGISEPSLKENKVSSSGIHSSSGSQENEYHRQQESFPALYGSILCWAENSAGQQSDPCVYYLLPAGPPEPVDKCQITNNSKSWLTIECVPGADNGMNQSFFVQLLPSNGSHRPLNPDTSAHIFKSRGQFDSHGAPYESDETSGFIRHSVTPGTPKFVIDNLPPASSYTAIIYSWNVKGRSSGHILKPFSLVSSGDSVHSTSSGSIMSNAEPPADQSIQDFDARSLLLLVMIVIVVIALFVSVIGLVIKNKVSRFSRRQEKPSEPANGEQVEMDDKKIYQSLKGPELLVDQKHRMTESHDVHDPRGVSTAYVLDYTVNGNLDENQECQTFPSIIQHQQACNDKSGSLSSYTGVNMLDVIPCQEGLLTPNSDGSNNYARHVKIVPGHHHLQEVIGLDGSVEYRFDASTGMTPSPSSCHQQHNLLNHQIYQREESSQQFLTGSSDAASLYDTHQVHHHLTHHHSLHHPVIGSHNIGPTYYPGSLSSPSASSSSTRSSSFPSHVSVSSSMAGNTHQFNSLASATALANSLAIHHHLQRNEDGQ